MEQQDVIIELREMSKSFKVKNGVVNALDKIDLKINRGEIFGIIGMSGAGKSTLVRCINLLERPTEGQVLFDGQDLTVLKPAELRQARRSMGMIFQQFNLLMQRTALENVCFPLEISGVKKEEAHKRAEELLEIVGLEERKNSYPSQLSGGQKQRVAIARALLKKAEILIFDDSTSALDIKTEKNLYKALKDNYNDVTKIIISSRISSVKDSDRIAVMDNGKIIACGNHETLLKENKIYQDIYASQFKYGGEIVGR